MNPHDKNHSIWIKIHVEIKEQKLGRNSIVRREKTEITSKINLIYDLKLKDNDTRQKIRMKTHNVTQSRAQIDPIDRQIKGFFFRNFEDEIRHSIGNFSLFFR